MNNSLLLNTIECANFTAVNLKKKKKSVRILQKEKRGQKEKKKKKARNIIKS